MSDRMTCLPFSQLLDWILDEFNTKKDSFWYSQSLYR